MNHLLDYQTISKPVIDMSKIKLHNSDYELAMAVMKLKIGDICIIEVNAKSNNILFCKKGRGGTVEFHAISENIEEKTYLTKLKASHISTARTLFRGMK